MESVEREYIIRMLEQTHWKVSGKESVHVDGESDKARTPPPPECECFVVDIGERVRAEDELRGVLEVEGLVELVFPADTISARSAS